MADMTIAEVLRTARWMIEPPGRWSKGEAARNSEGQPCSINDPDAQSWCAGAAVIKTTLPLADRFNMQTAAFKALREELPPETYAISGYNDAPETTHQNVLDLFERAIRRAHGQPAS